MENNLLCFKSTSKLTALSLPKIYKEGFFTEDGVWTKLTIIKGKMKFAFLNLENEIIRQYSLNPKSEVELIEPLSVFKITPNSTDLQFKLEFYCSREDYFCNKYNFNSPHLEVVKATKFIEPCKTLDLGAGKGRNSLYLSSLNFNVTAIDYNAEFLHELTDISIKEQLDINVIDHDISKANIKGSYDFIFSTDVFMYLNPTRIHSIITNIKKQTNDGGYNLIVSALNKAGHRCPPFPFTFIEGELKNYYNDWKIIKYNENLSASPYPYAVILAQKISE